MVLLKVEIKIVFLRLFCLIYTDHNSDIKLDLQSHHSHHLLYFIEVMVVVCITFPFLNDAARPCLSTALLTDIPPKVMEIQNHTKCQAAQIGPPDLLLDRLTW